MQAGCDGPARVVVAVETGGADGTSRQGQAHFMDASATWHGVMREEEEEEEERAKPHKANGGVGGGGGRRRKG